MYGLWTFSKGDGYMKTHQNIRLNWMKIKKLLLIPLIVLGVSACNGGGGGSGGTATSAAAVSTSPSVDFSGQAQLSTPTVAAATGNSCLTVTSASTTQNTASWVSGSFVITNSCSTTASVNGLQISMAAANSSLTAKSFSFNSQTGFVYPAPVYWAATTMTVANSTTVNGKTSLLLTVNTADNGVINSKSTATISYGYNPSGKSLGTITFNIGNSPSPTPTPTPTPTPESGGSCPGIAAWNSTTVYPTAGYVVVYSGIEYRNNWWTQGDNPATKSGPSGSGQPWTSIGSCVSPAPTTQGSIALSVDATSLKSVCTGSTSCNIPLVLNGQNGAFQSTVTTITNSNAGTIVKVNVTGLNTGNYTLTVPNGSLPSQVTFSAAPISVVAGTTPVSATATFSVTPISTGSVNYTVVQPNGITLGSNSITVNLVNSSNATVGSNATTFGQAASFNNITAGSYNLTSYGLADAKTGVYYSPLKQAATITAGAATNLGNVNFTKVSSGIVPVILSVTGLQGNDVATVTVTDSYNYTFNVFSVANGQTSLNMLNNDNVVFNISIPTKYKTVSPVSATISSGKVVSIGVSQAPAPVGQIVGYYETWLARATWEASTYSLANIPAYVNTITIAFAKPDAVYTSGSFSGTGLDFTPSFSLVESSIAIAHSKGQKVLLSVGGATYQNFTNLHEVDLANIVKDLHLDGIDIDFEPSAGNCSNLNTTSISCPTDVQLESYISRLRTALDKVRPGLTLSAAVWSIGAYGTPTYPTTQNGIVKYGPVGANSGIWVNPLKNVGSKLDELFLMSYDAGVYTPTGTTCSSYACYDPSAALSAYKAIYSGPIYQGIEVPPEAWGGNVLTPTNSVNLATTAASLGAAGTMIWALEVQGNGYTSNSFLQPICLLYNPSATSLCSQLVPLN